MLSFFSDICHKRRLCKIILYLGKVSYGEHIFSVKDICVDFGRDGISSKESAAFKTT